MRAGAGGDPRPIEEDRDYLIQLAQRRISPRLRGKVDASDIVQQAFLQAHERRRQYRGGTEGERLAWLRAILLNALAAAARRFGAQTRDSVRERSLERPLDRSEAAEGGGLAADQTSPSERVIRTEGLARLALAMARLPEDQRRAVELHYLGGLSVGDAAERLGRSRSAAVGLIFRGLKRLREVLHDPGGSADGG